MPRRTKAVAIAAFSGIYVLLGFLFWIGSSPSGEERALNLFKEKNYRYAHVYVDELEKFSNDPHYALFQGYILRANQDLIGSDIRLQQSLRQVEKSHSSTKLLMEIYLNQALNAYIEGDTKKLGIAISNVENLNEPNYGWLGIFRSIYDMKTNKQNRQEITSFERRALKYLSPWMQESFSAQFNEDWFEMHQIRWLIDEGRFIVARQKIDHLNQVKGLEEEMNFLNGLTYFKEGEQRALDAAAPYYKLAFSYFDQLQEKKHENDWHLMAMSLQKQVHELIISTKGEWDNFPFYFMVLEKLSPWIDSHVLVSDLALIINQKTILQKNQNALDLVKKIANSPFKSQMKNHMEAAGLIALKSKDYEKVEYYNQIMQPLQDENETNPFAETLEAEIIRIAFYDNNSLSQTSQLLALWSKLETDQKKRLLFAYQIVREAEKIWTVYGDHEKAIVLMKLAEQSSYQSEHASVHQLIETTIGNIYRSAVTCDKVSQYFCVMEAVRALKLVSVDVFNREETLHQLGDAEYYFDKHRFQEANERALWVLQVDPQNQIANRIAGLIAHAEGNFQKARFYLSRLKVFDSLAKEAFDVASIKKS